jgi:3',5'-cyclic-AMP phosphodiesterase
MHRLVVLGWAVLAVACTRPSEERARRDLEIGKAKAGAVALEVVDGLAVVRHAEPGKLALWMSAPAAVARLELGGSAASSLELSVENALPDLELRASGAITSSVLESSSKTRKTWKLRLARGSSELRLAPPDVDDRSPWRFAVMSDVQEAVDEVRDIYRAVNAASGVRFLLGAGDLTEQGSHDQLAFFSDQLQALEVPYYTTLGNHELGASTAAPPYQEWFSRASFRFVYRGVQFSMLDSASATIDPLVYDWLDRWLDEGRDRVHIVAMHIAPLDPIGVRNGAFASRNEAAKLLTRLANGKVDLTLYGHIHSYYAFENAGIPAYISGGGGAIPERFDGIGRHFLVVDVDPDAGIGEVNVVRVD